MYPRSLTPHPTVGEAKSTLPSTGPPEASICSHVDPSVVRSRPPLPPATPQPWVESTKSRERMTCPENWRVHVAPPSLVARIPSGSAIHPCVASTNATALNNVDTVPTGVGEAVVRPGEGVTVGVRLSGVVRCSLFPVNARSPTTTPTATTATVPTDATRVARAPRDARRMVG